MQDYVQVPLKICQEGDCTASLGNLCQPSVTCTVLKCFLVFGGHLLCYDLCPLPLVLLLDTTEKKLAVFAPSLQVFTDIAKMLPEPSLL